MSVWGRHNASQKSI